MRAADFLDGPLSLTLGDELARSWVLDRAVRSVMIVIHPPRFEDDLDISQ